MVLVLWSFTKSSKNPKLVIIMLVTISRPNWKVHLKKQAPAGSHSPQTTILVPPNAIKCQESWKAETCFVHLGWHQSSHLPPSSTALLNLRQGEERVPSRVCLHCIARWTGQGSSKKEQHVWQGKWANMGSYTCSIGKQTTHVKMTPELIAPLHAVKTALRFIKGLPTSCTLPTTCF